ncbi:MAG: SH3 domain-containing protein [Chloroflexota bacterium]
MDSESTETANWANSPIFWLLAGILFTIAALLVGLAVLAQMIIPPETDDVAELAQPTIIRLTAPPTAVPTSTPDIPTPTSIPTFTPSPTPNLLIAPQEVSSGFFAAVANTAAVNFRNGFGSSNAIISVLDQGTVALVIDGPVDADGFTWWQLELDDTSRGWVAGEFLIPAGEPETWRSQRGE